MDTERLVLGCDLLLQLGVLEKLQSGMVTEAELSLGPLTAGVGGQAG